MKTRYCTGMVTHLSLYGICHILVLIMHTRYGRQLSHCLSIIIPSTHSLDSPEWLVSITRGWGGQVRKDLPAFTFICRYVQQICVVYPYPAPVSYSA